MTDRADDWSGYPLDLVIFFEIGGAAVSEGAVQPGATIPPAGQVAVGQACRPGSSPLIEAKTTRKARYPSTGRSARPRGSPGSRLPAPRRPVGLDYSIVACSIGVSWPFWRLASSLRDLLGRLPARALLAQLPDTAGPARGFQGSGAAGPAARECSAAGSPAGSAISRLTGCGSRRCPG